MPLIVMLPTGDWTVLDTISAVLFINLSDADFLEFTHDDTVRVGELVGKYTLEHGWDPCDEQDREDND